MTSLGGHFGFKHLEIMKILVSVSALAISLLHVFKMIFQPKKQIMSLIAEKLTYATAAGSTLFDDLDFSLEKAGVNKTITLHQNTDSNHDRT